MAKLYPSYLKMGDVTRCDSLEKCLRKEFTAMAAVLQQDERVKKDIQMCRTCSNNIGCYYCTNA